MNFALSAESLATHLQERPRCPGRRRQRRRRDIGLVYTPFDNYGEQGDAISPASRRAAVERLFRRVRADFETAAYVGETA